MSSSLISFFFALQTNIKLHHWQTKSFACHKSTDELLDKIDPLIDAFVEIYFGKYGRQLLQKKDSSIDIRNMSDQDFEQFLKDAAKFLLKPALISKNDYDLLNIKDELVGYLNQAIYLSSFS